MNTPPSKPDPRYKCMVAGCPARARWVYVPGIDPKRHEKAGALHYLREHYRPAQ